MSIQLEKEDISTLVFANGHAIIAEDDVEIVYVTMKLTEEMNEWKLIINTDKTGRDLNIDGMIIKTQ